MIGVARYRKHTGLRIPAQVALVDLSFWLWTEASRAVILAGMGEPKRDSREHERRFRQMCRRQLRPMSDAAVIYQLKREVGGWEREEIAREGERRGLG